jgi:hypothetical protein
MILRNLRENLYGEKNERREEDQFRFKDTRTGA